MGKETRFSSAEKSNNLNYFIWYIDDDYKVKTLYFMLMKMSVYVKSYDGATKWMYILIEYYELLENWIPFQKNETFTRKNISYALRFLHRCLWKYGHRPLVKLPSIQKKLFFYSFLRVLNLPLLCLNHFYFQENLKLINSLQIA